MDSRPASTYPRKRALVACHTCRIKKTKCDNQRPSCTTCIGLGVKCLYSDSAADYSSFDAASLAILERVNYAASLLETQAKDMQQSAERSDAIVSEPPGCSTTHLRLAYIRA
ncbi:hypothetical protein AOQ84DRAFT_441474 [Glonium stellatum]|uniref:Zn(2)-C6 fungal-type domain-containing protein n=1 Tax=Glonium stellatum TaxID=574774 RepID=A0A8E2JQ56_9PEZI|nr:hypothetical protein AOQ84DRAFT_441474 [Glonium stellatum]